MRKGIKTIHRSDIIEIINVVNIDNQDYASAPYFANGIMSNSLTIKKLLDRFEIPCVKVGSTYLYHTIYGKEAVEIWSNRDKIIIDQINNRLGEIQATIDTDTAEKVA